MSKPAKPQTARTASAGAVEIRPAGSEKKSRGRGRPPGKGIRPINARVIEAIRNSQGMVAGAARALGVSRRSLLQWAESSPELRAEIEEQRETLKDRLESVAHNRAIEEGDTTLLIFLLRTTCRSRGYTERTEVTGADGGELVLTIRPPARDE